MNKNDFIEQYARGTLRPGRGSDGRRFCASLMYDNDAIYSYGYHYPLLFKLPADNDRGYFLVCNDRGYSNTTSKHIGVARLYSDFNVNLPETAPRDFDSLSIIKACDLEIKEHQELIEEALVRQIKRPRYEQTYQRRIDQAEQRIAQLLALKTAAAAVYNHA